MLTLSTHDIDQLQSTLRQMLAPLECVESADWRARVCREVRILMQVDAAAIILRDEGSPLVISDGALTPEATRQYGQWYRHIHGDAIRVKRGLCCWIREDVWSFEELRRTPYFNEYCRPFGNLDSAGISAPDDTGGEVVLYISSGRERYFVPEGREALLLRLLQPAFAAGSRALRALDRKQLRPSVLDALPVALGLFVGSGRLVHATPRLAGLLRDRMLGPVVLATATRMAVEVGNLLGPGRLRASRNLAPQPERVIDSSKGRYVLHATICEPATLGEEQLCLVTVTVPRELPDGDALRQRFLLTQREAEVALLIARGCRNRRIAVALGISEHTGRRHTERVLQKLGVQSRAEVAAAIAAL